jgi:hypothetical protein
MGTNSFLGKAVAVDPTPAPEDAGDEPKKRRAIAKRKNSAERTASEAKPQPAQARKEAPLVSPVVAVRSLPQTQAAQPIPTPTPHAENKHHAEPKQQTEVKAHTESKNRNEPSLTEKRPEAPPSVTSAPSPAPHFSAETKPGLSRDSFASEPEVIVAPRGNSAAQSWDRDSLDEELLAPSSRKTPRWVWGALLGSLGLVAALFFWPSNERTLPAATENEEAVPAFEDADPVPSAPAEAASAPVPVAPSAVLPAPTRRPGESSQTSPTPVAPLPNEARPALSPAKPAPPAGAVFVPQMPDLSEATPSPAPANPAPSPSPAAETPSPAPETKPEATPEPKPEAKPDAAGEAAGFLDGE